MLMVVVMMRRWWSWWWWDSDDDDDNDDVGWWWLWRWWWWWWWWWWRRRRYCDSVLGFFCTPCTSSLTLWLSVCHSCVAYAWYFEVQVTSIQVGKYLTYPCSLRTVQALTVTHRVQRTSGYKPASVLLSYATGQQKHVAIASIQNTFGVSRRKMRSLRCLLCR